MIDLDKLKAIGDAGHDDQALVGVPVGMIREIEQRIREGLAAQAELQRQRRLDNVVAGMVS